MSVSGRKSDRPATPNSGGVKFPQNWGLGGLFLVLAALLTAGCGADKPVEDGGQPQQQFYGSSHKSGITPAALAPTASTAGDPLVAADQLASGADGVSKSASDASGGASSLDGGDLLGSGPKMPTQHSHWLTVAQYDAHVTFQLNGVGLGGYAASGPTDITMKCHPGLNTLTLVYEPLSARSWMNLLVEESEHDPPIQPLILFHQNPDMTHPGLDTGRKPPLLKKTFTFIAR